MLQHGGIMVVGFLATVIGIERAVAVRSPAAIVAPRPVQRRESHSSWVARWC